MVMITRSMPDIKKLRSFSQNTRLNALLIGAKNAVLRKNTSFVIIVDGNSGLGKSTIANQIAITWDKNYSLKKLHYNPTTFLEGGDGKIGLENCKKGDCLVFDEAMLLSARGALTAMNRVMIQALSMIRSKQIFIIFCVNSIFDLDKNIAMSQARLLLHLYGKNFIDRGNFGAFFMAQGQENRMKQLYLFGKKYYSYTKPRANFIGRFTKEFIVDQQAYDEQKNKGVSEFLKQSEQHSATRANAQRDKLICYLREYHQASTTKIMELIGLSKAAVNKIIARGKKLAQTRD